MFEENFRLFSNSGLFQEASFLFVVLGFLSFFSSSVFERSLLPSSSERLSARLPADSKTS